MRVYCEHSAFSSEIRKMQATGCIEVVHFPYDSDSHTRRIHGIATPSNAQIRDCNLPIKDAPGTFADYSGSVHLQAVQSIIGGQNRRDALHVDSAFKSGCAAFITCDSDILNHRRQLESLLGIKFFHPEKDRDALQQFICGDSGFPPGSPPNC